MKKTIRQHCPVCKKVFKSFISDKRKYCSHSCYVNSGKMGKRPKNRLIKQCTQCGTDIERPVSNFREGLNPFCSAKCLSENFSENGKIKGNKNPNWNGGVSNPAYRTKWNTVKKQVKKRSNGICEICGKIKKQMDVHHIIPVDKGLPIEEINQLSNLMYLCRKCHIIEDKNRRGGYPNQKILSQAAR